MKIGFVGAGQMAQALAGGIANANSEISFIVADPSARATDAFMECVGDAPVEHASANESLFAECDLVFLAVKPQYFTAAVDREAIVAAIADRDAPPLVVSVIAGVTMDQIVERTSIDNVARVMPNTPCLVGCGASGISFSSSVPSADQVWVTALLEHVGIVIPVAEGLLDAVTGLSGSGPAYVFEFIDALALGGVRNGLPRNVAQELAIQTVLGAATLAKETGDHPAVLRDRVTSPGGTTIAGLKALHDNAFPKAVISAVEEATSRSKELRG